MHGVKKQFYTIDQQELKRKEREKKLDAFLKLNEKIFKLHDALGPATHADLLNATEEMLLRNPDIGTLWNYRREIMEWMAGKDEENENLLKLYVRDLKLTLNCLMTANPKSYGAWHHRGWVICKMEEPDLKAELGLCNKALKEDERNFHCWDYRRLICKLAGLSPEQELEFSDAKVSDNFSNYSNWHYRSVLLPKVYPSADPRLPMDSTKMPSELELVQNAFYTDPEDSSSWFYRQWLVEPRTESTGALEIKSFIILDSNAVILLNKTISWPMTIAGANVNDVNLDPDTIQTPTGSTWSNIFYAPIENFDDFAKNHSNTKLAITLKTGAAAGDPSGTLNSEIKFPRFERPILPEFLEKALQEEVKTCRELLALEPTAKWPLRTLLDSLQVLEAAKESELEILQLFDTLVKIDSKRRNYYMDMRSKFLIEQALGRSMGDSLDLSGKGLTAIYHSEYFLGFRVLNLSNNDLRSLKPLEMCLGLKEFNCADNPHLDSLDGLWKLTALETIDASRCSINDGWTGFGDCPTLKSLELAGNPAELSA